MNVEENVKKENESASEQKEVVNKEVKKELKEKRGIGNETATVIEILELNLLPKNLLKNLFNVRLN